MKNLFYLLLFLPIALLTSCSDSSSSSSSTPSVSGCTDDCALNYNPDANQDDGSCIYSVLGGAWVSNSFVVNGVEQGSNAGFVLSFDELDGVGMYSYTAIFSDGTSITEVGTFTNTLTSLTFTSTTGGVETWSIDKINCYELDATLNDPVLGIISVETDWSNLN